MMRKYLLSGILAALALFVVSCEPPASNTAQNTNAGSNTTAAAPTMEQLFEMDKKANEAWMKGDSKHFEDMLSDKFVSYMNGQRSGKADELKMIGATKCETKTWGLDDPHMTKINDDTYVVTYRSNIDATCTFDGKSMKIPSPTRAASVWVRDGANWKGVYHNETPIIDPKNPPAPAADDKDAKKEEAKKDDSKGDTAASSANTSASANTAAAPAKPSPSANTDALVKMHQAGWDAWKAKDAKWFEANLASNMAFVDPIGTYFGTKADAIKQWTETMKCEGVTKATLTDGFATAISPTVEILTLKGTADGTCDGQKNGPLYQTAIYVKDGDAWKLAYMFESPAM